MARRPDSGLTGDQALTVVQLAVEGDLSWLARAQPLHDYGIDMHVEPFDASGYGSGHLLGLQVKGGPAYFQRRAPGGWWHKVSAQHAHYWLNHALPVVIVLVDLSSRICYWVEVNERTLVSTGKNYKVLVPQAQIVQDASVEWSTILEGRHVAATERFEENLSRLPPSCARKMRAAFSRDRTRAALLALDLAQAIRPADAVAFALGRRDWLTAAGIDACLALANYCAEHALFSELVDMHLLCAEVDHDDAAGATARAALAAMIESQQRAEELASRAIHLAGHRVLPVVDVMRARTWPNLVDPSAQQFDSELADRLAEEHADVVVLQFRAASAMLSRNWSGAAIAFELFLAQRPEDSARMLDLARCYLYRGGSIDSQTGDLERALIRARSAIEQRRRWGGPTVEALVLCARILGMEGRLREAYELCQPVPLGSATSAEASDPEVVRLAAFTAQQLGAAPEELRAIVSRLFDADDRADAMVEFGVEGATDEDQICLLERLISESGASSDPLTFSSRIIRLAVFGIDRSQELARLPESAVATTLPELVRALAASQSSPGHIDPVLHELATVDQLATETLINAYLAGGQDARAMRVAHAAYERFRQPHFVEVEIDLRFRAGEKEAAEALLQSALIAGNVSGRLAVKFRSMLGVILAERNEFARALELFRGAADLPDSGPEPAWNAVRCAAQLERWHEARSLADTYKLTPATEQEIELWVTVLNLTGWSSDAAKVALQLAEQPGTSTQASNRIVTSVVNFTRSADEGAEAPDQRPLVPGELRRKAFQLLADLAGDDPSGPRLIKVDFDSPNALNVLGEAIGGPDPEQVRLLLESARNGRVPIGVLGLVLGDPYALILAKRPLGVRYASTIDGDLHESENVAAIDADGGEVVIDLSVLDLAPDLTNISTLVAQFERVVMSTTASRDLAIATAEARAETASAGRMRWDVRLERLVFTPADAAEQLNVLARVEQMRRDSRPVEVQAIEGPFTVLAGLTEARPRQPWVDSIELACRLNLPLWADDVSLRLIARAYGVAAFGTVNLLESRRLRAIEDAVANSSNFDDLLQEQQDFVARLRDLEVVDQPLTLAELIDDVERSGGVPSRVSAALGRAAWWGPNTSISGWLTVRDAAIKSGGDWEDWLTLAMRGIVASLVEQPDAAIRACVAIALLGDSAPPTVASARRGLGVAELISEAHRLPSPRRVVADVARVLANGGALLMDPAQFVMELLADD